MANSFLADFAVDAHAAFLDAGLADVGTFTPQRGAPVPCSVMVDRDPHVAAMMGVELVKDQAIVTLIRAGISASPRAGDTISITASGERFTVSSRIKSDEGAWVVLCQA